MSQLKSNPLAGGAPENTYRKGSYRLVDKGEGRMVLEETTIEDAAALDSVTATNSLVLDTSGLSLQGESGGAESNPYDSNSALDTAAMHWAGGTIR